jgi:hypothetical protein
MEMDIFGLEVVNLLAKMCKNLPLKSPNCKVAQHVQSWLYASSLFRKLESSKARPIDELTS